MLPLGKDVESDSPRMRRRLSVTAESLDVVEASKASNSG